MAETFPLDLSDGELDAVSVAILNLRTGASEEELRLLTGWTYDEISVFTMRDLTGGSRLSESELDLVLAALLFALTVTSDSEAEMFIGLSHAELSPIFGALVAKRTGIREDSPPEGAEAAMRPETRHMRMAPAYMLVDLFAFFAARRGRYLEAADTRPATFLGTRLADVAAALGDHRGLLTPLLDAPQPAVRREAAEALRSHQAGPGS